MSREYEHETPEETISRLADEHTRKLNEEIEKLRAELATARASLDLHDRAISTLLAEVERLTRDRDLAERKAAVCREDVEISARRAESAEAEVAKLEAFVTDLQDSGLRCDLAPTRIQSGLCKSDCDDFYTRYLKREDAAIRARASALLSPQPAPCGKCGDSGSGGWPCGDCGAGAGMPPKTAPKCGKCGGSGQVAVMRVEIVRDENGEPGGEWVGDSEPCHDCRGGGK